MKTFKEFILENNSAPKMRIVSATGVNGSGQTTVTYEDGTTEVLTGPRPIRNNNPGNLEDGPFSKRQSGYAGGDGRYAVFATKEDGYRAKINLLKTETYQNLSIRDAFNRYAPPSENPTYIRDLQQLTGFDLNRKMSSLSDEEFKTLVNAVAKIEGAESYMGNYNPPAGKVPDYNGGGPEEVEADPSKEDHSTWKSAIDALYGAFDTLKNYGKSL
jgi:hypothetical protein